MSQRQDRVGRIPGTLWDDQTSWIRNESEAGGCGPCNNSARNLHLAVVGPCTRGDLCVGKTTYPGTQAAPGLWTQQEPEGEENQERRQEHGQGQDGDRRQSDSNQEPEQRSRHYPEPESAHDPTEGGAARLDPPASCHGPSLAHLATRRAPVAWECLLDRYEPDERFAIWPLTGEEALRKVLGTEEGDGTRRSQTPRRTKNPSPRREHRRSERPLDGLEAIA